MTPHPSHRPSFASRAATFFKRLIVTTVVLALGGATVFLLSQINSKTFTLENRDGKLVVLKGRMMPMGADPWLPADAALADAYAPIELEGTSPMGVINVKYEDRDSLDRALFSVIEGLARPRVQSDEPKNLEQGLYFLRRGEKLSGLTDEQRLTLKTMRTDVAFYTARKKLEDGQRQVEEALAQLKLAGAADSKHSREANQMISTVEPQARALAEALRRAVNLLSAPATDVPAAPRPATPDPALVPSPAPSAAGLDGG
jgi:hypothetical protein